MMINETSFENPLEERTEAATETDTNFSRNPYFIHLQHLHIFQEPLFSHRTDIHFPEALSSSRTLQGDSYGLNRYAFSRKVPPSNRYFINRSRWLLLKGEIFFLIMIWMGNNKDVNKDVNKAGLTASTKAHRSTATTTTTTIIYIKIKYHHNLQHWTTIILF